ncbi:MAG: anthranilate synthase component II [Spirochaetota bacterium]
MFCVIDNYDSFTYNLVDYVSRLGEKVEVFKNDHDPKDIPLEKYTGVIISPGPSTPENSGITPEIIRMTENIPVFGVCLGMQAIASVFGGSVVHASQVMHGKLDEIEHYGGSMFRTIPPRFNVVRYHSLAVSRANLPGYLNVRAVASDGEIMALSHTNRFLWGVQFHPESYLTDYGLKIIENFIGGSYEYKKLN